MWLGIWMPFAQAAEALAFFTGVTVSELTVRRTTEGAGAAYEAVQTAAVETIEQTLPLAPAGPAVQVLSVDGAMAPLVHQEWAEVKTLALETLGRRCTGRARAHVNPLVALCTIAGNDRWAEAWPQLAQEERRRLWQ
ncbi:MAG: hypothetical protein ACRERE_38840 [Candidatus Entotheonellia bacterium]